MEEKDSNFRREEIFSRAIRAGKRTYFFDVKATKSNEYYLTITESKRKFNNEQGKFYYEKHKVFLYKEDFDKFTNGLSDVIEFIETNQAPVEDKDPPTAGKKEEKPANEKSLEEISKDHTDVEFEDLDDTSSEEKEEQ